MALNRFTKIHKVTFPVTFDDPERIPTDIYCGNKVPVKYSSHREEWPNGLADCGLTIKDNIYGFHLEGDALKIALQQLPLNDRKGLFKNITKKEISKEFPPKESQIILDHYP